MAHTVKFIVYTRYEGMFDDDEELEYEEEVESEYATYEEAERHADADEEGCVGQFVEVFLDGKHYRDYDVEEQEEQTEEKLDGKVFYQVVFCQRGYTHVDYETDNYDQALEVKSELQAEMSMNGERDFYYIIEEVRK